MQGAFNEENINPCRSNLLTFRGTPDKNGEKKERGERKHAEMAESVKRTVKGCAGWMAEWQGLTPGPKGRAGGGGMRGRGLGYNQ